MLSSRAVGGTSIVEQPYASTPGADLWSTTRLQTKKGATKRTNKGIRSTEPLKKEIDWGNIVGLVLFPGKAIFVQFYGKWLNAGFNMIP